METQTIELPEELSKQLESAKRNLALVKEQRNPGETDLLQVETELERIPEYFQREKELIEKIINQSEENFKNATSDEEIEITGKILQRTNMLLIHVEKYWAEEAKTIMYALRALIA